MVNLPLFFKPPNFLEIKNQHSFFHLIGHLDVGVSSKQIIYCLLFHKKTLPGVSTTQKYFPSFILLKTTFPAWCFLMKKTFSDDFTMKKIFPAVSSKKIICWRFFFIKIISWRFFYKDIFNGVSSMKK